MAINPNAVMVIKSTFLWVATARVLKRNLNVKTFCFHLSSYVSKALYDNLHPSPYCSRWNSERAQVFANLLLEGAVKKDVGNPVYRFNRSRSRKVVL